MSTLIHAAKSGDTFELPERYTENICTVWKLLKVSFEDNGSRWGVYILAEEAAAVDGDDLRNLTPDELQGINIFVFL
jgi:hypothetical protein